MQSILQHAELVVHLGKQMPVRSVDVKHQFPFVFFHFFTRIVMQLAGRGTPRHSFPRSFSEKKPFSEKDAVVVVLGHVTMTVGVATGGWYLRAKFSQDLVPLGPVVGVVRGNMHVQLSGQTVHKIKEESYFKITTLAFRYFDDLPYMCIYTLAIETLVFLALDGFVLSVVFRSWFEKQLQRVQGGSPQLNVAAAVLCYAVLIAGLYYFILREGRPVRDAFFLGLFVYGVYETTNKSILRSWDWRTVAMDTTWGGFLFAFTTAAVYALQGKRVRL